MYPRNPQRSIDTDKGMMFGYEGQRSAWHCPLAGRQTEGAREIQFSSAMGHQLVQRLSLGKEEGGVGGGHSEDTQPPGAGQKTGEAPPDCVPEAPLPACWGETCQNPGEGWRPCCAGGDRRPGTGWKSPG